MTRYFSLFLLTLALLSVSVPAWASVIYVSGDQTGTWSADTVIVTGEVRVPPGESLTILPGVEVLFSVYCKLIVDSAATLRAVGTPTDSIRFDILPPDTAWHGIRFLSASDASRLDYCVLSNGSATGSGEDRKGGAIYCSSASPTINHSTLQSNSARYGGGIYCNNNSNTIIIFNTISRNSTTSTYSANGGGIYCDNSSPLISGNTISCNTVAAPYIGGGGIYCYNNSHPMINGNTIRCNAVTGFYTSAGGGIYCHSSSPTITGNYIIYNSVNATNPVGKGGGIYCYNSNLTISGNTIYGNSADDGDGGGIVIAAYCNPIITSNIIRGNSVNHQGGGIFCQSAPISFEFNEICENSALDGGGIYLTVDSFTMNKNSIVANTSINDGGGIYCYLSTPTIINSILWGNNTQQIFCGFGYPQVCYSDVQGSELGIGTISANPLFVNFTQGDYRLQWGSPCIDSGDPNPIYNDPDGSRADMGAWYYDQSLPVRILLTPYNTPIQIPAGGGSFQYAIQVTNIESSTLLVLGWCNVTLPSGAIYGPVLGPLNISLGVGQTLSRVRTQAVPAGAPAGLYHYNAFAIAQGDTSTDSFTFVKLGADGWNQGAGGWTNTGEDFIGGTCSVMSPLDATKRVPPSISPNPFNATTVIRYQIPDASYVSLRVYDTAGRLVETLVDGWREAGTHEITWEASGFPSGMYFLRLETPQVQRTQKMILCK